MTTTKTNKLNSPLYSSSNNNNNNNDDEIFSDEKIQRYDADTIKQRYGDNWRNYASNVRDIKQADGSIVREYIIEDPNLINEIKPSIDSTSSATSSDNEQQQQQQQQSSKNKFAQIKAKFEQQSLNNVMASPSSSSVASSHTTTTTNTRRSSNNKLNDNRIDSSTSTLPVAPLPPPPPISTATYSNSQQSRSVSNSSFQRLNSANETDEEVQRIHRQGAELRQHQTALTPISSIDETNQQQTSEVQYEVVDEDGNPMAINDVQDLIKMSGVTAREVSQADGTIIREYVIDDPQVLSKFQSQQPSQSSHEHIPPPPPRIPLKQSALFRQQQPLTSEYDPPPINIQQVRTIEPQRRYEFVTSSGKRIEFMITNSGAEQTDVHELANAIDTRLRTSSSSNPSHQPPPQQPFTHPKPWHPAIDLTHREPVRQRTSSDNQPIYDFQQAQTDLDRSVSYGTLNQGMYQQQSQQFDPIFAEPIIDWSAVRQQDPHGQIDPQFIQQYIAQKHQNGAFQTSAQFLPEQQQQQAQMSRSMYSPSRNSQQAQPQTPVYYQQSTAYPYQGQQQHGVRIHQDYNYNQAHISDGHTRI